MAVQSMYIVSVWIDFLIIIFFQVYWTYKEFYPHSLVPWQPQNVHCAWAAIQLLFFWPPCMYSVEDVTWISWFQCLSWQTQQLIFYVSISCGDNCVSFFFFVLLQPSWEWARTDCFFTRATHSVLSWRNGITIDRALPHVEYGKGCMWLLALSSRGLSFSLACVWATHLSVYVPVDVMCVWATHLSVYVPVDVMCVWATHLSVYVQPGAMKLVLCGHWMQLSYMRQWRQRTNFIAPGCTSRCNVCMGYTLLSLRTSRCNVCMGYALISLRTSRCNVCMGYTLISLRTSRCNVCMGYTLISLRTSRCNVCMGYTLISLRTSRCNACAHYVIVSKIQWKSVLACHPALSTVWLGWVAISCELWYGVVNYDIFAQAPFGRSTTCSYFDCNALISWIQCKCWNVHIFFYCSLLSQMGSTESMFISSSFENFCWLFFLFSSCRKWVLQATRTNWRWCDRTTVSFVFFLSFFFFL